MPFGSKQKAFENLETDMKKPPEDFKEVCMYT